MLTARYLIGILSAKRQHKESVSSLRSTHRGAEGDCQCHDAANNDSVENVKVGVVVGRRHEAGVNVLREAQGMKAVPIKQKSPTQDSPQSELSQTETKVPHL